MDTIFTSSITDSLTFVSTLAVIISSLLLGLFISSVYINTYKKEGHSGSFPVTLIMLPAIISVIILLVGSNVARAFSLAGAFSLIRFRSSPGDPKDIAYVFFTLGVGLACGMGYIAYGAMFAAILCTVMIILTAVKYGTPKNTQMQLKITIPENLDYQGVFDDILSEYTGAYKLQKVKTTDFGTLFELLYSISLKDGVNQKQFIDKLRCRNGNLKIILSLAESSDKNHM